MLADPFLNMRSVHQFRGTNITFSILAVVICLLNGIVCGEGRRLCSGRRETATPIIVSGSLDGLTCWRHNCCRGRYSRIPTGVNSLLLREDFTGSESVQALRVVQNLVLLRMVARSSLLRLLNIADI